MKGLNHFLIYLYGHSIPQNFTYGGSVYCLHFSFGLDVLESSRRQGICSGANIL